MRLGGKSVGLVYFRITPTMDELEPLESGLKTTVITKSPRHYLAGDFFRFLYKPGLIYYHHDAQVRALRLQLPEWSYKHLRQGNFSTPEQSLSYLGLELME